MSGPKNKIIIFLISYGMAFLMLHAIVRLQVARQTKIYVQEINSVHTKIEDRFKLSIDAPLAIGITGAAYMATNYKDVAAYQKLAQNVVHIFEELLGLTILDTDGKIVRVYPENSNPNTLGKITQNISSLKLSYKNKETYWLSPPFDLYQGQKGFAFYVPMINEGKIVGWIAPVVSVDYFFKKFIKQEFLETFHLVIQDVKTQENYFSTSSIPAKKNNLHINYAQIRGREVSFLSWRREKSFTDHDHWPFSAIISLLIASLTVYAFWLFEQNSLSRRQLNEVNTLLNITSRDTSAGLDGIQHQLTLMKQGSVPISIDRISPLLANIMTMIHQITVLQRIAIPGIKPPFVKTDLKLLFKEVVESHDSVLAKKNLMIDLPDDNSPVEVNCNKWLICHSVFGNILQYLSDHAAPESIIKVKMSPHKVSFHFDDNLTPEILNGYLVHGLYVARQVMIIHQGDLTFGPQSIDVNFKI